MALKVCREREREAGVFTYKAQNYFFLICSLLIYMASTIVKLNHLSKDNVNIELSRR
jgi:hypothetical protein